MLAAAAYIVDCLKGVIISGGEKPVLDGV